MSLYWYKAKYIKAYDGDTVTVDIDLGFNTWMKDQTIRLYGIDTPELRGEERERGLEVRDYIRRRLEGQDICIKTYKDKKGKYGRWLAEIYIGEENLNDTLIEKEYAVVYS